MDRDKVLTKLKYNVNSTFPFFSALSRSIKLKVEEELPALAATDGAHIYFNPDFFKLDFTNQIAIYIHEVAHMAFKHVQRQDKIKSDVQSKMLFNIIGDAFINTILSSNGIHIHNGIYINNLFDVFDRNNIPYSADDKKYIQSSDAKLEESYLRILKNLLESGNKMGTCNDESGGEQITIEVNGEKYYADVKGLPKNMSEEQKRELERKIEEKIIEGIVEEKMRGNSNSNIVKLFETLLMKKEVNWKAIVKQNLKTMLKGNRTYSKIHKKSLMTRVLLPGYKPKQKFECVIGIDVSGSINKKEYMKFLGEIYSLMKTNKSKLSIALFDTKVREVFKVKSINDLKRLTSLRFDSGGTAFHDFLEKFENTNMKIVFTDGHGDQRELTKKYKNVIWLTTDYDKDFKFGKVIKIKNQ